MSFSRIMKERGLIYNFADTLSRLNLVNEMPNHHFFYRRLRDKWLR